MNSVMFKYNRLSKEKKKIFFIEEAIELYHMSNEQV